MGNNQSKASSKSSHNGQLIVKIIGLLVWTLVAIFGAQIIIGFPLYWITGQEFMESTVGTLIYSALSYLAGAAALIMIPVWIKKIRGKKSQDENQIDSRTSKSINKKTIATKNTRFFDREGLGLKGWPTWTDIGLAIVGYLIYTIIAFGIVSLFSLFPWFDSEQAQEISFSTTVFGLDRMLAFIALVVIAPIAEELIFRGWLYDRLRVNTSKKLRETASIIISALLTSVLFGAVHMQWNVGVNVFAMSLVMCGMREITGTIYSGILLHMIKNGVAFYLLFVLGI